MPPRFTCKMHGLGALQLALYHCLDLHVEQTGFLKHPGATVKAHTPGLTQLWPLGHSQHKHTQSKRYLNEWMGEGVDVTKEVSREI